MEKNLLAEIIINKGNELFISPRIHTLFVADQESNNLLNNIDDSPHAFVIACIMDRQVKAEIAWGIPQKIKTKLGRFDFPFLANLTELAFEELMTKPYPLHRFPKDMAKNIFQAVRLIENKYSGIASNIWNGNPSSAEVVYRFFEFKGVGQKIGTMATNILARDFKIRFSDYYSIDISVDVHVRRVFSRLGFIPKSASDEMIIYKARALSPAFPGLLDLPIWEIGRTWCKPTDPICESCYMSSYCSKQY